MARTYKEVLDEELSVVSLRLSYPFSQAFSESPVSQSAVEPILIRGPSFCTAKELRSASSHRCEVRRYKANSVRVSCGYPVDFDASITFCYCSAEGAASGCTFRQERSFAAEIQVEKAASYLELCSPGAPKISSSRRFTLKTRGVVACQSRARTRRLYCVIVPTWRYLSSMQYNGATIVNHIGFGRLAPCWPVLLRQNLLVIDIVIWKPVSLFGQRLPWCVFGSLSFDSWKSQSLLERH